MRRIFISTVIFLIHFLTYGQEVELIVQTGHTDRVTCIDVLKTGTLIATGGMDQMIKLWDVKTGYLVRSLYGHTGMVYQVKFSPDGKFLYSCSWDDYSIRKWDISNGKLIQKITIANNQFSQFDLDVTGKLLSACCDDTVFFLSNELQVVRKIPIKDAKIAKFSQDGAYCYVAVNDGLNSVVKQFSSKTFTEINTAPSISSIDYMSIQGSKILLSSYHEISQLDFITKTVTKLFEKDSVSICSTILLKDGKSFVFSLMDGTLYTSNAKGQTNKIEAKHSSLIREMVLSENGNYLYTSSYDRSAQLIEIATGKNLKFFRTYTDLITDFVLSESGGTGAFANTNILMGSKIGVWNFHTGKYALSTDVLPDDELLMNIAYNESSNSIIGSNTDGSSNWYAFPKSSTSYKYRVDNSPASAVALTTNGKNGLVGTVDGKFIVWRPERNKAESFDVGTEKFTAIEISPDGTKIVAGSESGVLYVVNFEDKKIISKIESHSVNSGYSDSTWVISNGSTIHIDLFSNAKMKLTSTSISDLDFNVAGDKIAVSGGGWITVYSVLSGELLAKFKKEGVGFGCVDFSNDGNHIVASGANKTIYVFNMLSGLVEYTLEGHQNEVRSVYFSKSDKYIVSAGLDGQLIIWDVATKKELVSFITAYGGKEFIVFNQKGYYYASKGATKLVSYRIGNRICPFEQFDSQYNRPDLILKDLSKYNETEFNIPINSQLIKSYYQAYTKRLQRLNLTESEFNKDLNIPKVTILAENDKLSTTDSVIAFQVKAQDLKFNLKSLHIEINGVPIYGTKGLNISGHETTIPIKSVLSYGLNSISVYCFNQSGVRSYIESFEINYSAKTENFNTYFIGIGVQSYLDTNFNLKYSAKDINDVGKMFADKYPGSKNILLTNEQVTKENILNLRKTLENTNVNDQIVLLLSGHGLLSEDLNFYYATYNVDFEHPQENGILYEDIEGLLNGIPARKKLILLDACHSGELDKSETVIEPVSNNSVDSKIIGSKGQKMMMGLSNSYELMKDLFADLQAGSGTTIIASSSGKYFSYEFDEYKNGVFTFALKEGLNGAADENKDKIISVSELQNFITKKVSALTKGKQEPTSRQINMENNWRVW